MKTNCLIRCGCLHRSALYLQALTLHHSLPRGKNQLLNFQVLNGIQLLLLDKEDFSFLGTAQIRL